MLEIVTFMFSILALGGEGAMVEISPAHLRVPVAPTNVTIVCRSTAPITSCQFSWWSRDFKTNRAGPVLDLTRGADSFVDLPLLTDGYGYDKPPLLGYAYSGRGFPQKDCGVRMLLQGEKTWMVSCRVKTHQAWVYNWMDLSSYSLEPLANSVEPREVVVVPGGKAKILLEAGSSLKDCKFNWSIERWLKFDSGASSFDSNSRHLYHGAGPARGQCGLELRNITERDNGPVFGYVRNGGNDGRLTSLIVARPPTPPVLKVTYTGDNLTATCSVKDSRPAPNITWLLGEDVILQDSRDDQPGTENDPWRWPWTAGPSVQTIDVHLQPKDSGRRLKCSVNHVALTSPLEATEVVHFRGKVSRNFINGTRSIDSTPSDENSTLDAAPQEEGQISGLVGGACPELWAEFTQLQNTCRLKGGATDQQAEEIGRLTLEAAKARVRQEAAKAEAALLEVETARSWSMIAQEEVEFKREWRRRLLNNSRLLPDDHIVDKAM